MSKHSAPNVFEAYKIARYLDTSVEYLVSGKHFTFTTPAKDGLLDELKRLVEKYDN